MGTVLGYPKLFVSRAIVAADANTTVEAIELPAKHYIPPQGVMLIVTTAISGGTPAWTVGDGSDPDGWVATDDITEASAGAYAGTQATTDAYATAGKYYSAADTIDVVVTTGMSSGSAKLFVLAYDLSAVL